MLRLLVSLMVLATLSGCAVHMVPVSPGGDRTHPNALLISQQKGPLSYNFDNTPVATKSGSVEAVYFWDFLITGISMNNGEVGIQQAAKAGGLSKVYYADYEVHRYLGIFSRFSITAYGE